MYFLLAILLILKRMTSGEILGNYISLAHPDNPHLYKAGDADETRKTFGLIDPSYNWEVSSNLYFQITGYVRLLDCRNRF